MALPLFTNNQQRIDDLINNLSDVLNVVGNGPNISKQFKITIKIGKPIKSYFHHFIKAITTSDYNQLHNLLVKILNDCENIANGQISQKLTLKQAAEQPSISSEGTNLCKHIIIVLYNLKYQS